MIPAHLSASARKFILSAAFAVALCGASPRPAPAQTPDTPATGSTPAGQVKVEPPALKLPPEEEYMKAFARAQKWEVLAGKTVVLHYVALPGEVREKPKGKGNDDKDAPVYNDLETARKKLGLIEKVFEQGRVLLGVEPVKFLVPVYLFPTAKAQGKAFGTGSYDGAASQFVTVTCRDGNDEHVRHYLAHEMAHILIRHCIADPLPDFLQEGTAVWVQLQVIGYLASPDPTRGDASSRLAIGISSKKPLKSLCNMSSDGLDSSGGSVDAASFVEYIVSTGETHAAGVARLRAFLRAVSQAKGKPDVGMEAACREARAWPRPRSSGASAPRTGRPTSESCRSGSPTWTFRGGCTGGS